MVGMVPSTPGLPRACVLAACLPPALSARFPHLTGHAVIVSDRLVRQNVFTSRVGFEHQVLFDYRMLGREELTRDIPGVRPHALRHLDPRGLVRVGTRVWRGDVLIGKVTPRSVSELTYEDKLTHCVFGRAAEEVADESLVYPHPEPGMVTAVRLWARSRRHCPRCGDVV